MIAIRRVSDGKLLALAPDDETASRFRAAVGCETTAGAADAQAALEVLRAAGVDTKGGFPCGFDAWPLPNVALGVSAEDQQRADETYDVKRLRELLYTAGAGLVEIASAVGFEGNAGDLGALLAHCRALRESRDEVERLRTVIRTGGAAYRLERAAMGIPGGIDADGQPIVKAEDQS
ncbi:MAG: hypothetical protein AMXMBFR56_66260 [Polyangiaceae bacterium]